MFYALRTPAPQNVTSMRLHAIWTYRKHQLVAAMHVGTVVCLAAMLWALWWANHSISVIAAYVWCILVLPYLYAWMTNYAGARVTRRAPTSVSPLVQALLVGDRESALASPRRTIAADVELPSDSPDMSSPWSGEGPAERAVSQASGGGPFLLSCLLDLLFSISLLAPLIECYKLPSLDVHMKREGPEPESVPAWHLGAMTFANIEDLFPSAEADAPMLEGPKATVPLLDRRSFAESIRCIPLSSLLLTVFAIFGCIKGGLPRLEVTSSAVVWTSANHLQGPPPCMIGCASILILVAAVQVVVVAYVTTVDAYIFCLEPRGLRLDLFPLCVPGSRVVALVNLTGLLFGLAQAIDTMVTPIIPMLLPELMGKLGIISGFVLLFPGLLFCTAISNQNSLYVNFTLGITTVLMGPLPLLVLGSTPSASFSVNRASQISVMRLRVFFFMIVSLMTFTASTPGESDSSDTTRSLLLVCVIASFVLQIVQKATLKAVELTRIDAGVEWEL